MNKNKQGFTLIEMVIVILIIGIMAGVLFPSLSAYREHNREQERAGHEIMINKALKQVYALTGVYPIFDNDPVSTPVTYTLTTLGETQLETTLVTTMGFNPNTNLYSYSYADPGANPLDPSALIVTLRP